MVLSPRGAAFLRLQEGFRRDWYLDVTRTPTIGIGFTWASAAFRQWWTANRKVPFAKGATMSEAEADACLQLVVADEYGAAVNRFLGKFVPQHVFDAMCSVTFNCGPGTLDDNWAAAVKRGDYPAAARFLRTTRVTSKRRFLQALADRRAREALLLEKGIYTGVKASQKPTERPVGRIPAPPVAKPAPMPQPPPAPPEAKGGGGLRGMLLGWFAKLFSRKEKP